MDKVSHTTIYLFIVLVLAAFLSLARADDVRSAGRVVLTRGEVRIGDRIPVPGGSVYPGDVIRTGIDGSLKLLMHDRTILDLGPSTSFRIKTYQINSGADRQVDLGVDFGRVRSSINQKLNGKGRFQLRTKSSVLAVRGTEFIVLAGSDGEQDRVSVVEGRVSVASAGLSSFEPLLLGAGERMTLSADSDESFRVERVDPIEMNGLLRDSRVETDGSSLRALESTDFGGLQSPKSPDENRPSESPSKDLNVNPLPGADMESSGTLQIQSTSDSEISQLQDVAESHEQPITDVLQEPLLSPALEEPLDDRTLRVRVNKQQ